MNNNKETDNEMDETLNTKIEATKTRLHKLEALKSSHAHLLDERLSLLNNELSKYLQTYDHMIKLRTKIFDSFCQFGNAISESNLPERAKQYYEDISHVADGSADVNDSSTLTLRDNIADFERYHKGNQKDNK